MRFGALFSSGFGDHDAHVAYLDVQSINGGTAYAVRFEPASGLSGWFGLYVDSALVDVVYAEAGAVSGPHVLQRGNTSGVVQVLRHGGIQRYSMTRIARALAESTAERVVIEWQWPAEVIGAIDSDGEENPDLSSWSLSGLTPEKLLAGATQTRYTTGLTVVVDGSDATVTLSAKGRALASGTVTAPGSCTLTEENDSGVSGSVTVGAAPSASTGAALHIRFPASMAVVRDETDPPSTEVGSVAFTGTEYGRFAEASDLSAAAYYYGLQVVSDTGATGSVGSSTAITIPAPPEAPTDLAYSSGGASATVLSFTASGTSGATYRAYLREPDQSFMDMVTPAATALAGSTTITLPAISGYAGTAQVILRAVSGGVEDQNANTLEIEYDAAGARVAPRPNDAFIQTAAVGAGDDVSVLAVYNATGEAGTAATIELFTRTDDGSYNYASAADSQAISAGSTGRGEATLTATGLAAGWHYVTVRAATSGGVLSANDAEERLVYISNTGPSAPTFEAVAARG